MLVMVALNIENFDVQQIAYKKLKTFPHPWLSHRIAFSLLYWLLHQCLYIYYNKVSPSIVPVLLPWAHTYPTKFMRAMFTCHMVTTIIFLNKDFTFRARFGISSYPSFCREILCIPLWFRQQCDCGYPYQCIWQ